MSDIGIITDHSLSTVIVVPSNQSDWISRLLDNGAQAIIVSSLMGSLTDRCHALGLPTWRARWSSTANIALS